MAKVLKSWDELEELFRRLENNLSGDALVAIVEGGSTIVHDWIVEDMGGAKSGRSYSHLPNRSSAAGETPAVQSGELVNSLERKTTRSSRGRATAVVTTANDHAALLEYGSSRMAPRPFMRPGLDRNAEKIGDLAVDVVAEVVKNV